LLYHPRKTIRSRHEETAESFVTAYSFAATVFTAAMRLGAIVADKERSSENLQSLTRVSGAKLASGVDGRR
jgi:hypothetical protein